MRIVLFFALAAIGFAQTRQDAVQLLREVADASHGLGSFRAEGTIRQAMDPLFSQPMDFTFYLATRVPGQFMIDVAGGPAWMSGLQRTVICHGAEGWDYLQRTNQYKKVGPENLNQGECVAGTLTTFEHLADDIKSAVVTGNGTAQFEGNPTRCIEVKAVYRQIKNLMLQPGLAINAGRVSRNMCIDPIRKLVLRETFDGDFGAGPAPEHFTEMVTYNRIERNPVLLASLFDFQPPAGSEEIVAPKAPITTPATAPPPIGVRVVSMPEPLSKLVPEYSQEAWDEGIQGKEILWVDVDAAGLVGNIKVDRSLGWGLDEKAIECLRQARFAPAMDTGKPVNGTAWVQLEFTLPDKRPDRASVGPVSRPVTVRLPNSTLADPTDLEIFLLLIAVKFRTAEPCARIRPLVIGGSGGFSARGYQAESMRSRCYDEVATIFHDPKLCEHVIPVNVQGMDGSLENKAYCLSHLHGPTTAEVPDPNNMDPFVHFMQKLGYDDRGVAGLWHREAPHNNASYYTSYSKLRDDPAFLRQVLAGPGYAELRAAAKIRPARPVEYLYQMVAVDTANANLCAKISPNATFPQPPGQSALLQSTCYLALALNLKNAAYCASLPRAGTFPFVHPGYDSRESCEEGVATYSRPGSEMDALYYGSISFPRPSDIQTAMASIGYVPAEPTPQKMTPDDYGDFLEELSLRGSSAERAEFVRRVMTLR